MVTRSEKLGRGGLGLDEVRATRVSLQSLLVQAPHCSLRSTDTPYFFDSTSSINENGTHGLNVIEDPTPPPSPKLANNKN